MRERPLGQSGISASVVGLGTWAIGGWMWGGSEENEAIAAIHTAIDEGMNLIDTAPIYGFGASERIIGEALKGKRDKVVLATKCGMVCNPTVGEPKFNSEAGGPNPDGIIKVHVYQGPDSIRREVEESLRRLQTDYIDLYQTHWQDPTTPIAETMGCLMDLKKEGKIRAIGVSNASPEQMDEYRKVGPVDSDQEKYSMLDRELEGQLAYCRKNNIAVLGFNTVVKGLLTGKMGPGREFSDTDQRKRDPRFTKENRTRVADMLQEFEPITKQHGLTLAQLVIAWTVHQPGLTHALCGARRPEQARENAAGGSVELSDDELNSINKAIEKHAGQID